MLSNLHGKESELPRRPSSIVLLTNETDYPPGMGDYRDCYFLFKRFLPPSPQRTHMYA